MGVYIRFQRIYEPVLLEWCQGFARVCNGSIMSLNMSLLRASNRDLNHYSRVLVPCTLNFSEL